MPPDSPIHNLTGIPRFNPAETCSNVLALANTGSDASTALRQAHEFAILGGKSKMRAAALLMQITDIHAAGLENAQGLLLSVAYYWNRNEASRNFGQRFYEKIGRMPTMVQAGLYSATMHYLKAVAAAGTDSARPVLDKMHATPVNDFFAENGHIREDGMHIHDYYLLRVKSPAESKRPWDYADVVATIPGKEANITASESACPLLNKKQ